MSLQHSEARGTAVQTVNEFCVDNRISRSELYKAWREGTGPRFFLVGSHRRISCEAAAAWRAEREHAAATR
jgi:hypothetical protein